MKKTFLQTIVNVEVSDLCVNHTWDQDGCSLLIIGSSRGHVTFMRSGSGLKYQERETQMIVLEAQ